MSLTEAKKTMRIITDIHARYDVTVTFSNGMCATNGKMICINAGDPNDIVWRELVEAKITHEAGGHIRFTDFSVLNTLLKGKSEIFRFINNTIEDVRVESACINHMSGTYWVFRRMSYHLFDEGYWSVPAQEFEPSHLLTSWLLYSGRGYGVTGQEHLQKYGNMARKWLEDLGAPAHVFNQIEARMVNWKNLPDTKSTVDETTEVLLILRDLVTGQPPQTPPSGDDSTDSSQGSQSGDDSQDGNDSDDSSQGSQSGDDSQDGNDSDDSSQGSQLSDNSQDGDDSNDGSQGSQSNDDSQDGDDQDQANGSGSPQQHGYEESIIEDMISFIQDLHDVINQAVDAHAADYVPGEILSQYNQPQRLKAGYMPSFITTRGHKLASGIRRVIESQLWAKEAQERLYDDSGSDFDDDLLAGIPAGNNRIFFQEDIVETYKSAIALCVDMSGSMGVENRMVMAHMSTVAIVKALEDLDIPTCVVYFNDDSYLAKTFEETSRDLERNCGVDYSGSTETHVAIAMARRELDKLDIDRKQIIVLTDGGPNRPNAVLDEVLECKRCKIDIAAINIMIQDALGGIENQKNLTDIDKLPDVLEEVVRGNLLSAIVHC